MNERRPQFDDHDKARDDRFDNDQLEPCIQEPCIQEPCTQEPCFEFHVLISAAIDGELDHAEVTLLDQHMDNCSLCCEMYQRMVTVNDWVVANDRVPSPTSADPAIGKQLMETSIQVPFQSAIESTLVNGFSSIEGSSVNGSAHPFDAAVELTDSKAKPPLLTSASTRTDLDQSDYKKSVYRNSIGIGLGSAIAAAGLWAAFATHTPPINVAEDLTPPAAIKAVKRIVDLNQNSELVQLRQYTLMQQQLRTMRMEAISSGADEEEIDAIRNEIEQFRQRLNRIIPTKP